MIEDLAPYEERKYYNFKNLFFARIIYNAAGLKYFYNNHQTVLAKPYGKNLAIGFVLSCALFDVMMIREFMKNRDRTDVMFH